MLSVKNLSKRFGTLRALERVNFEVPPGTIVGIIGPNGAGKTTLLLSLAGFLTIDSGTISWNNRLASAKSQFRSVFFYVDDAVRPHALLPVDLVVSFYASVFHRPQARCGELIDRLVLGAFLRSRVSELSKGAAKRFLIALGLLSTQPVLLLDEPFDGLDLRQTMELIPMFRGVADEGRTLVLSIHQLRDAERVCDRFVLLNNGRLAGTGTLPELQAIAGAAQGSGIEEIFLALT
jgi:ABC-2 type transport system ATP-binding protein